MGRSLALGVAAALAFGGCSAGIGVGAAPSSSGVASSAPVVASASASIAEVAPPPPPSAFVLPGVSIDGPLFADELDRVFAASIAKLGANTTVPVTVLSKEKLADIDAIVAAGKLRADGPVCAAPASRAEVLQAAYPGLLLAQTTLSCTHGECSASTELSRFNDNLGREEPGDLLFRFDVSPKDPASVDEWLSAIGASQGAKPAAPEDGPMNAMGSAYQMGEGPLAILRHEVFGFETDLADEAFKAELATAGACRAHPEVMFDALLAVDEKGAVSRCAVTSSGVMNDDCTCKAISKHKFEPGKKARRVFLEIYSTEPAGAAHSQRDAHVSAGKKKVHVWQSGVTFDDSREVQNRRATELMRCFQPRAEHKSGKFSTKSTLDERGVVTAVSIETKSELSNDEEQCVLEVSKAFTFRCPAKAGDTVWNQFGVSR